MRVVKYLTVKELKELIGNLPDDGEIYFRIPEDQDELYWRDSALVRTGEVRGGDLYLEGKPIDFKESHEELKAQLKAEGRWTDADEED